MPIHDPNTARSYLEIVRSRHGTSRATVRSGLIIALLALVVFIGFAWSVSQDDAEVRKEIDAQSQALR